MKQSYCLDMKPTVTVAVPSNLERPIHSRLCSSGNISSDRFLYRWRRYHMNWQIETVQWYRTRRRHATPSWLPAAFPIVKTTTCRPVLTIRAEMGFPFYLPFFPPSSLTIISSYHYFHLVSYLPPRRSPPHSNRYSSKGYSFYVSLSLSSCWKFSHISLMDLSSGDAVVRNSSGFCALIDFFVRDSV